MIESLKKMTFLSWLHIYALIPLKICKIWDFFFQDCLYKYAVILPIIDKLQAFLQIYLNYRIFLAFVFLKKAIMFLKISKTRSFVAIFWQLKFWKTRFLIFFVCLCMCDCLNIYVIIPWNQLNSRLFTIRFAKI